MARRDYPRRARPKSYTDDFKRDAVRLVTEQKYSIAAAANRPWPKSFFVSVIA